MTSNTVKNTVEKALREVIVDYFAANPTVPAVDVLEGQTADERQIPCCVVLCDAANPVADFNGEVMGNYNCSVTVMVLSNATDTTPEEHRDRADNIEKAIVYNPTLVEATFNDYGLHLYFLSFQGDREGREGDNILGNNLTFEATVCLLNT